MIEHLNNADISLALFITGIIPFSRLGGFCANLDSAEIFFCHQRKGSSEQMVNNIFRLLVKSNKLCRYSDNKLGFQSQDRQLCKPFYSRAKCVLK